ncbi:MAG: NDP-sugar synthase [Actinomycetota bacterium]|nr:NDP-sugar synthase [Actinomycetota bacterium]
MDAIVLVGGQGTRLRPLTITTPKPMLPTAGVPFLAHLLSRARDAGVDHVVLSTSYRAEVFESYFGTGSALGLEIDYVTEVEPLGTGGGIRNVAGALRGDDVLVFNGDVLSGVDLRSLVAAHRDTDADVTLHLTEVADPRPFGLVPLDDDGRVTAFLEKPTTAAEIVTNRVNAGCYVFDPAVLAAIPAGRPVSVERETFPGLLASGALVRGYVDASYWLDLGTPAAFVRGSADLVLGHAPSSVLPGPVGESLVLATGQVDPTATLTGGSVVGAGAAVGAGAQLDAAVVFDGAVLAGGVRVVRSVVGAGARIGPGTVLEDAVVGDGAVVGAGNELRAGARVWPGVRLADGAVRFSSDR